VISENPTEIRSNHEEQTDEKVEQALKDHYVNEDSYLNLCREIIMETLDTEECDRALSVGCSVGRMPFELAKKFKQSCGIDYTARFFQMATRLCESGSINYKDVKVNLEKFDFRKENVSLYQFNPENPDPKKLGKFDFIFVDGKSLRCSTLMRVLKKIETLAGEQSCKVAVISVDGKNELDKEEIKSFERKWQEVKEESL